MAERIKRSGVDIRQHWEHLIAKLDRKLAKGAHYDPVGYSYYLRGHVDVVRIGNAFITGDAAGLATRDMCEGIGPAIRSGLSGGRCHPQGRAVPPGRCHRRQPRRRHRQPPARLGLHPRGGTHGGGGSRLRPRS